MSREAGWAPILIAEDDPDDRVLLREALEQNEVPNELTFVGDGQELLDALRSAPPPSLILLDLNMPRLDGRQALKVIKSDERLKQIPIVVLTTSHSAEDIRSSYELGANSFITKPMSFQDLLVLVRQLKEYWFHTVRLPV